jgi:hypothetical protein
MIRTHVPLFRLKPVILVMKRTYFPLISHLVSILGGYNVNSGSGVHKSDEEAVFLLNKLLSPPIND